MFRSIKNKIVLPIVAIIFFTILGIVMYVNISTSTLVATFMSEKMDTAVSAVSAYLDRYDRQVRLAVSMVANSADLLELVLAEDNEGIWQYINDSKVLLETDAVIVANREGIILAQSHVHDFSGDYIGDIASMEAALAGHEVSMYTPTPASPMVVAAAHPIMHEGEVVGGVVINFDIGVHAFIDRLSAIFGVDVTIFDYDTSVASTLIHPVTGARAEGTTAAPHISEAVLGRGEHLVTELNIFGLLPFHAYYFPLPGAYGDPIGMFFIGISQVYANETISMQRLVIIILGVAGLIVAVLLILFVVSKITNPINRLKTAAQQIADGNLSVNFEINREDEIGVLARSFSEMQREFSDVMDEIHKTSREVVNGHLHREDTDIAFKGAFQEILYGIDEMALGFSQYLDDLPCGITIFDKEYRFSFINAMNRGFGYSPDTLLGKTVRDAMSARDADFIMEKLEKVASSKKFVTYSREISDTSGETFYTDNTIMPILDNSGNINTYLQFAYNVTEVVKEKNRSDKISAYQEIEAEDITKKLKEGLEQGVLKFEFEPERHDEDTAKVAYAYRQIGETLEHAVSFIKQYVEEISYLLQEFSHENFDVNIGQTYRGDFNSIRQSMEGLISSIGLLVSEIQSATAQVETGASQISHSTQDLMSGFEEQAAIMNEVKDAVTVLTEKTQKNAEDAEAARGLSEQVRDAAGTGSRHMQDMSAVMEEIKLSSVEIAKVTSIIGNIAFQTNLLALNASVEAARAGEHGKGFSVVADEVKSLAGRSADAAKETAEMITKSISRVEEGVAKSIETNEALKKIVEVTTGVSEAISNIANVSNEQAEEISKIQNNIETIHVSASNNSASVQSNATVSEELSSQASTLMSLVERFKIGRK